MDISEYRYRWNYRHNLAKFRKEDFENLTKSQKIKICVEIENQNELLGLKKDNYEPTKNI